MKKFRFRLLILFCFAVILSTQVVRADNLGAPLQKANEYLQLGDTDNAEKILTNFIATNTDPELVLRAQGMLGNAFLQKGQYQKAISEYEAVFEGSTGDIKALAANNLTIASTRLVDKSERDLVLVREEKDPKIIASLTESISKQKSRSEIYRALALKLTVGRTNEIRISALLNANEIEQAARLVAKLPASTKKVNLLLQLANKVTQPLLYLLEAKSIATEPRTLSFTLKQLGDFYYSAKDYSQAESYLNEAILLAQSIFASDLLYPQWHLLGDIYQKQGKEAEAFKAWQHSIAYLQKIRGSLAISARHDRLDFNRDIDPIYQKSIESLMKEGKLSKVRSVSDLHQLSELETFFGDLCLTLASNVQPTSNGAAIISTFIFDDYVAVLLQLPDGSYHQHRAEIRGDEFVAKVKEYRKGLETIFNYRYLKTSTQLYDLLLRPLETRLIGVKELIFINDGVLRNVPMATLFDGNKFLVEKYPISYSLSPNFKAPASNNKGDALIFGLSLPIDLSMPLSGVIEETENVLAILGGDKILNEDFTIDEFTKSIESQQPSTIHIATHGKFTGLLERSYLQAFDGKITLLELEKAFSSSNIDLLVLSGCQTAAGNDKSVLGMAGVAMRSGVSTVVGSLWSVADQKTSDAINSFYTYLKRGFNYSQALQKMQIERIRSIDKHPINWSSLIVINN